MEVGSRYRHYKGNLYQVIALAKHSETLEDMVVYQALYGEYGVWCRPASMWSELVNGKLRFEKVADMKFPTPREE